MAPNPDITAIYDLGKPDIYLDKDFVQKFHDVDDAIRHEKSEKLLRLVENGEVRLVNLSEDPLLSVVIAYGKSNLAIELIEKMPPENLEAENVNGDTALHVAVARGDESVVEALVKKNEYLLRIRNNQLESPLHKAALLGQRQIFWKLVDYGSNADARTEDGATMLHYAVMGNAPELALEIAMRYSDQMAQRNSEAVTPLQLLVTIPEAFRSQLHFGPLESLIYECIPLKESFNETHEMHAEGLKELPVHETSDARYKDDECLQFVIASRRKFPPNYATFMDILELACIPVRWVRLLVFNILKQLFNRVQELEDLKKNQKQTMKLIAYLAKDPRYWDFIDKGRIPQEKSEISGIPPDISQTHGDQSPLILDAKMSLHEIVKKILTYFDSRRTQSDESPLILDAKMSLHEFVKQILMYLEDSEKSRWNESPLILGAKMGLHDFVKQILTVCPASAAYLDAEGRNVLQVAIQHGHEKIVDIIESMASGNNPILPSWLLSGFEGETKNTIWHFAAVETVKENFPAIQMQYELQWFERVKGLVPKDLKYSRNKEQKTAAELFNEKHKDMVQNGKVQLMEIGKTCSSLVAAVVFASSFSIPGEKDVNNNPVFLHKTAFKVFSHAYVVGLSCAATALVLFLSLLTSPYRVQDFRRSLPTKYFFANVSFFLALVFLLVAFTCNIYLNIYGGRKAETKDIVPLVCELTIFPAVCIFVLLYRGSTFGFGSFLRRVWR